MPSMPPHGPTARISLDQFEALKANCLRDLDAEYDAHTESLKKLANISLLCMPKEVRKATVKEIFPPRAEEKRTNSSSSEEDAAVAREINQQVAQKVHAVEAKQSNTAKKQRTARKRAPPVATPLDTVRRSGRKRTTANLFETPSMPSSRGRHLPMSTPLITPKFDMATPLNRSVFRNPKPNETLVSLSGSPVNPMMSSSASKPLITTVKKAHRAPKGVDTNLQVPIKLARGNTLVVPMEASDAGASNVTLDDEARRKLEALQSNIESLLKNSKAE